MNYTRLKKYTEDTIKKTRRIDKSSIASQPLEDHLNTLADIIIERILEERNKNTTV